MTQTGVAKAAGIPQGHLTYYFPKKRDLVLGVAARFAEVTATEMQAYFAAHAGEPLRDVVVQYTRRLISDRERTRMLLGLLVMSDTEPALADILRKNASMLRALLAATFQRSPDDPVVDLLLALLWGLGIHDFVLRGGQTSALLERALTVFETKE